jgi:predicted ribosomally synthesized peptide with SipW-like signal peptide
MKKSTSKKALIASAAAVSLSALLFAGTTYAWFTDSASSATSVIKSGNLAVGFQVYDANEEAWVNVTEDTNLLTVSTTNTTGLWEPGHVEIVKLKVSNEGSLALKYNLGINAPIEYPGEDADGNEICLSDYLKFALVTSDEELDLEDRDAAIALTNVSENVYDLSDYSTDKVLLPKDVKDGTSEVYVTLAIYMPTTVGNEANFVGEKVPEIQLQAVLNATQTEYEEDSFGKDYDEDAYLESVGLKILGEYQGGGVYTYEGQTYINYKDTPVAIIQPDDDADVFVDEDGQYYMRLNTETPSFVKAEQVTDPDTNKVVNGLYLDEDGGYWVGTAEAFFWILSH